MSNGVPGGDAHPPVEQLSAWLDGELDAAAGEGLASHLEGCPACSATSARLGLATGVMARAARPGLAGSKPSAGSPEALRAAMDAYDKARPSRRAPLALRRLGAAAAAAAVLAAAGYGLDLAARSPATSSSSATPARHLPSGSKAAPNGVLAARIELRPVLARVRCPESLVSRPAGRPETLRAPAEPARPAGGGSCLRLGPAAGVVSASGVSKSSPVRVERRSRSAWSASVRLRSPLNLPRTQRRYLATAGTRALGYASIDHGGSELELSSMTRSAAAYLKSALSP